MTKEQEIRAEFELMQQKIKAAQERFASNMRAAFEIIRQRERARRQAN